MYPETVASTLPAWASSVACAVALGLSMLAAQRSTNIRVGHVWWWCVAALTIVLGGSLVQSAGHAIGWHPPVLVMNLAVVGFGLVMSVGAFRTAMPGTLPALPITLDILPPAFVVVWLSAIAFSGDVDGSVDALVARLLVPGVMAATLALMPEALRAAGGRRTTLSSVLLSSGVTLCAAAGLAPVFGAPEGFSGLTGAVWVAGFVLFAVAARRRAEAPARPDPQTDPAASVRAASVPPSR